MSHRFLLAAALCAACLAAAPVASAAEVQTHVTGWTHAPGPRKYDRLDVTKFGNLRSRNVLILVPGTNGGRGDFTLDARDIVRQERDIQVWAVDRRSQALEDTSVFRQALAGTVTPQQMFSYYAGWIADPSIQPHYQPPDAAQLGFAADWGLKVQLEDVRAVIAAAHRGGATRVLLGGHSLGASVAVAYAAWDFDGHPGYRDLNGLVLIDGGLLGSFDSADLAQARTRLAAIRRQPFLDLLGLGLPWVTGILSESAAILALKEPDAPSVGQRFSLLPAAFKPPIPVTNEGQFGFAFDATTSPKALGLIQVRAGSLGSDGRWVDGEVSPIRRVEETFGQEPGNAVEWFYPARLNLDVDAASPLVQNSAAKYLGLRLKDAKRNLAQSDLALYALQTSLTNGAVLKGAKKFARLANTDRYHTKYVDASRTDSHLDPLTAAPERSAFLRTFEPWLQQVLAED
ncbi:alpha/beta fold hydrolase [Conexibacter woesei]|uniref:alpha/beta fold hydrolase n=1 Tax=Conexibacter woesei TaxID=191495 RepID=UPI0004235A26|nr:alpha/beta fold hydrolase [Conexibacter woesei]